MIHHRGEYNRALDTIGSRKPVLGTFRHKEGAHGSRRNGSSVRKQLVTLDTKKDSEKVHEKEKYYQRRANGVSRKQNDVEVFTQGQV